MAAVLKSQYVTTDGYMRKHNVEGQIHSARDEVMRGLDRKSEERRKKEFEGKIRAMEGQEIPNKSQKKELCTDAKKEIEKANAAKEELEAKLKDGSLDEAACVMLTGQNE